MRIELPSFINHFLSSIPFVNSLPNLGDIFQKQVVLPLKKVQVNSSYLQQKNVVYGLGLLAATVVTYTLVYLYRFSNRNASRIDAIPPISQLDKNDTTPPIIKSLIAEIESKKNLDVEGIYRVPGLAEEIPLLVQALEQNSQEDPKLESRNIHTLTGSLKALLRKLVLPSLQSQYELLKQAAYEADKTKKMQLLSQAFQRISKESFDILKTMIIHLKKVAAHSSENKMDIQNLVTAAGPSFIDILATTQKEAAEQQPKFNSLIQFLIENSDLFF